MKNLLWIGLIAIAATLIAVLFIFIYRETNERVESIRRSTASISLSTARISLTTLEIQLWHPNRNELLAQSDKVENYFRKFSDYAQKANEDEAAQRGEKIAESIRDSLRPLIETENYSKVWIFLSNLRSSDDYLFLMLWQDNLNN